MLLGNLKEKIAYVSIVWGIRQQGLRALMEALRKYIPDISGQEFSDGPYNCYSEIKRRGLQAFQCQFMLDALAGIGKRVVSVVDVGDSAGTHMLYLRQLTQGKYDLQSLSVNLDPRAIDKIKSRGLEALLCRAEELKLDRTVDLFVSFEMLEHLHNPARFLRGLSCRHESSRLLLTVPYLRVSRVGIYQVRQNKTGPIHAEEEHIFELNPSDWTLLARHSGWKIVETRIYRHFPGRIPLLSPFLSFFWRRRDFEGFWGVLLERETSYADKYLDWEI
jgi:hypothetical protein